MKHNAKVVLMSATTSTAQTSGATTIAGVVDTLGFRYASVAVFHGLAATGPSSTIGDHIFAQSDTNVSTTFAAVSGFAAGTDWTPTTTTAAVGMARVTYNIDLRGKKRYLKVTYGANAAAGDLQLVATLTNAENGVATASEQNAAFTVNG